MTNKKMQIMTSGLNQKHVKNEVEAPPSLKVPPMEYGLQGRLVKTDSKKEAPAFLLPEVHQGRALLLLDENGTIKYCSPAVVSGFGAGMQALIGQPVTNLLPELPVRQGTPGYNLAYASFQFRDGQWLAFSGQDSQGRKLRLEATLMALELDGRSLLLLELRTPQTHADEDEKLRRLQEASELSGDAVAITDTEGLIVYVNPALETLTGYSKDELLGHTHAILKADAHEEKFYTKMWEALQANETFRGQFVHRRKNGTLFYEDKIIRPYRDACGKTTHFIASGRDISERVKIMRRLEHFANYDGLTGLPNRNLFLDRLQQAQAHASRSNGGFALMLLDVDHFKTINDTFGHAVGDAVLQTAASRLKQCLREEDTVARLGGDEFSLILEKVALRQDVKKVLEKIAVLLREPLMVDGQKISIQASIGIAFYPEHGEDGHTLLRHADSAMYGAKANGGNDYLFFEKREIRHHSCDRG
ncbi:MAG TPA: diguanylate cyclase [Sulfuriferula sp.]|nr:diguanylate cyclase [Sulfuriferula sp.]